MNVETLRLNVKGLYRDFVQVLYSAAVDNANTVGTLRIGELARRTGVTPELLRAWEQRYGLLRPSRSPGGFRLYSAQDEGHVRAMTALIAEGLSAAEAARHALADDDFPAPGAEGPLVADLAARLRAALDAFDAERAHAVFDQILASVSVETLVREVVLPYLSELGHRWERGDASIAQEHFASNLLRGRLLGLAREWARGPGPALVLACPPGEEHDLGLIMCGIALAARGRRVVFLGASTPVETLREAVAATRPEAVVLAVTTPAPLQAHRDELRALANETVVLIGGAGATEHAVAAIGARAVRGDPVDVARAITS